MYAQRKNWELNEVGVNLQLESKSENNSGCTLIKSEINLIGNLSQEQKH